MSSHERLFAGQQSSLTLRSLYANTLGLHHYSINSLLYLRTVQFPVFIQPYIQQPLILYQIETVPIPIIDQNTQAQSYTHLQIKKPYIALKSETNITIRQQIKNLQKN